MRYLVVVRHAHAHDGGPSTPDVQRALSEKGRRQCARLREWADSAEVVARLALLFALVSPATRTRETYELGFAGTGLDGGVDYVPALYNGRRPVVAEEVLSELEPYDDGRSLMVVGHNPTVRDLVDALSTDGPFAGAGRFPKGAAVVLEGRGDQPLRAGGLSCAAYFDPSGG